jgi:hypothetical protein
MKNTENYKNEIFDLFKSYLEISKQADTNTLEDEMIKEFRLKNVEISERDLELINELYFKFESSEYTREELINLLKK